MKASARITLLAEQIRADRYALGLFTVGGEALYRARQQAFNEAVLMHIDALEERERNLKMLVLALAEKRGADLDVRQQAILERVRKGAV